jgi:hypothetical protein
MTSSLQLESWEFYPIDTTWSKLVAMLIISNLLVFIVLIYVWKNYEIDWWFFAPSIGIVLRRWLVKPDPILTISPEEITSNTPKFGVRRIPLDHLHRIWIGRQKFRRFLFWHQETDAIFVTRDDDKSYYFQRLDLFKKDERPYVKELVERVQKIIGSEE